MVLTDVGRTLALGAAAVAGLLDGLGLSGLLVVAFVVGGLSVFFDVAYQVSVVRLVTPDQLVRGNSALEGSRSAAQIGGPALGGALVSLLSAPIAAASGALFFALSFLSIRRIVMAVRQAVTPDGMQGRAAATITFVGMGLTPLGSLLGGFLAAEWGLRTSLLVTAAGMMSSPVLMALSPLARLGRELPAPGGGRGRV